MCEDECLVVFGLVCEDFYQVYIKVFNLSVGDVFGISVFVDGDCMVIGVCYEDGCGIGVNFVLNVDGCDDLGVVYVYECINGVWVQIVIFKLLNVEVGDEFGILVLIEGDIIVVGLRFEDSCVTIVGGLCFYWLGL